MLKNKDKNKEKGDWGEKMALEYLLGKGHVLVLQNYNSPYGEIDLITKKDRTIHFTEVKTVYREKDKKVLEEDYKPEENAHFQKISRISKSAEYFMFQNNLYGIYFQIDLVTVRLIGEDDLKIDYFPNINL